MNMNLLALTIVLLVGCLSLGGAAPDEPDDYLGANGDLKHKLTLRVAQEGVVGQTGEIWTVDLAGDWSIARFVKKGGRPDEIQKPRATGKLTREQVKGLAKELEDQNCSRLPEQFGRDAKVNRHLITIQFGEKKTTLVLRAGEKVAEAKPDDTQAEEWRRFARIVQVLKDNLKE